LFIPEQPYLEGSAMAAMVLAHQGGWDEMLLVLVPIAVVVALIAIARRRIGG
jgi:hypothetical protein